MTNDHILVVPDNLQNYFGAHTGKHPHEFGEKVSTKISKETWNCKFLMIKKFKMFAIIIKKLFNLDSVSVSQYTINLERLNLSSTGLNFWWKALHCLNLGLICIYSNILRDLFEQFKIRFDVHKQLIPRGLLCLEIFIISNSNLHWENWLKTPQKIA